MAGIRFQFVAAKICLILAVTVLAQPSPAQAQELLIGTGSRVGVYYVISDTICQLIGRERRRHGMTCDHQLGGSVINLNDLHENTIDVAIAQSDWHARSYNGTSKDIFPGSPFRKLRSLFSVHQEIFTVVAGENTGIKSLEDLTGKRLNIGSSGSGHRQNFLDLMKMKNWSEGDFDALTAMPSSQHALALCSHRIDAFVYTVGHPNSSIMEAASLCGAHVLNIENNVIIEFSQAYPYYKPAIIGSGTYVGQKGNISSFGVAATVVATSDFPDDKVYEIVRAVFGNFDKFKNAHPSFGTLDEKRMITKHLTAPLHSGAIRYYKEQGWL